MLALAMSGFGGFGAANSEVQRLQESLKTLSSVANYPASDPGETNGVVGPGTVMAIAMWAAKIPKMPSEVGQALPYVAGAWSIVPDAAKNEVIDKITRFAKELTVGVLALAAIYTATTSPPAPPKAAAPAFATIGRMLSPAEQAANAANAAAAKYKKGSVARFNTTRNVWSVYSPLAGGYGLGVVSDGRCMGGSCLGDGEVTPAVPAGFVKAGEEIAPPAGITQAGTEADKTPFYKNPIFWAVAAGGVAVVGTGGYFLMRRKAA